MPRKLSSYAVLRPTNRSHVEDISDGGDFSHDFNKIVFSSAFRRLEYKTQVFLNNEGDLFRTRLTHSLEVASVGRYIAHHLGLNEDLVGAIGIAHDLGHTPYGHAGQEILNHCMVSAGNSSGFEHNMQAIRIVTLLEQQYLQFDGLNLAFETLEGILKHCSLSTAASLGALGERFLLKLSPSLEAQIADIADEITYNHHDLDDALRAQLFDVDFVCDCLPFVGDMRANLMLEYPDLSGRRLHKELIRRLRMTAINDVIETTQYNLDQCKPHSVTDVRNSPVMAKYSADMLQLQRSLKKFLRENMYENILMVKSRFKASAIIEHLFDAYVKEPRLMPLQYRRLADTGTSISRIAADYISGMTDRYASKEHEQLE